MSLKRKHTALVFSSPSCHTHTLAHPQDTHFHALNELPNVPANNGNGTNAESNESCIFIINKQATQFPTARQRAENTGGLEMGIPEPM